MTSSGRNNQDKIVSDRDPIVYEDTVSTGICHDGPAETIAGFWEIRRVAMTESPAHIHAAAFRKLSYDDAETLPLPSAFDH
jgi:hypothetical protein